MKSTLLLSTLVLISAIFARSQTSTPPAPANHAQMHAHQQDSQAMCKQMMEEHVAEMKTTSQTLANNLAQMKSTLPMISDLNERSRWQSNIAMWQALADHFQKMAQHAEHVQAMGMGCGMMMSPGMGGPGDHGHSMPATPPKPQ